MDVGEIFGVHGGVPGGGGELVRRGAAGGAGAVHQDVDGPEGLFGLATMRGRGGGVRQVGGKADARRGGWPSAASIFAWAREQIATRAPWASSACAQAKPMPLEPPVTRAALAAEAEIHQPAVTASAGVRMCCRAATSASIISSVCFGPGVKRRRSVPCGTVG